ncbi:MAG: tRNA lysidine(34) synthetase TilS [Alphaproteobacteria bacterium]|nr:tRNA lysidine(34) synthetase TilS [Alphaproteobacteria bacterium]
MTISPAMFEALMKPFDPLCQEGPVAVAFSGGPDSTALAFCLQHYLSCRLVALLVEHGLRPESKEEAEKAAKASRDQGIETFILPWHHDPLQGRLHVKARQARYALLFEACRARGIKTLFLAHHADDQAETVLMRFAKGSGVDGLSGMPAIARRQGITLARPFLDIPKETLVETCRHHGLFYVIDPSNEKEQYARGRLRKIMPLLAQEGLSRASLLDMAARAREASQALDFYARDFLRKAAQADQYGGVFLELSNLRGLPLAVAGRVVRLVMDDMHKKNYAPPRSKAEPFLRWLRDPDEKGVKTWQGCLIKKGEQCDRALFVRERMAIKTRPVLKRGQSLRFDECWQITWPQEVEIGAFQALTLAPLGHPPHALLDRLAPDLRKTCLQAYVRASLPALWDGDELASIPAFVEEKPPEGYSHVFAYRRMPSWLQ